VTEYSQNNYQTRSRGENHCGTNGNSTSTNKSHCPMLAVCYRSPPKKGYETKPRERWGLVALVQRGTRRQQLAKLGILKKPVRELPRLEMINPTIDLEGYRLTSEQKYSCSPKCRYNGTGYCEAMILKLAEESRESAKLNGSAPDLVTFRCTGMICPIDMPGCNNIIEISHYKEIRN